MNQTNQTFWMTNWTFQMTNWTIWKHLISNSMNWMTNATNDLTTQKTNWTNPWTNSPEQLNLKWNNDRMNESLLFYKDGERLCKEKTWIPLWQKRAGKSLSLTNKDWAFQKQIKLILLNIFQFSNWPYHFYVDWSNITI